MSTRRKSYRKNRKKQISRPGRLKAVVVWLKSVGPPLAQFLLGAGARAVLDHFTKPTGGPPMCGG